MKASLSRLSIFATVMIVCTAATGLTAGTHGQTAPTSAPPQLPDFTFSLTRLPEDPGRYSLVISDSDEHVLSSAFSISQLETLLAVLLEAEKFALNEEGIGTNEPLTTRFQDKKEQGLSVDVEKFRNQSRLFLTLTTDGNGQTAEAGRINRSTRREVGFLFDLLSRLEALFPKLPTKPNK